MANRQPGYQIVKRESDIIDLIPGDRVLVAINQGLRPERMVYATPQLEDRSLSTECEFIQIPDNYGGGDPDSFLIWKATTTNLRFIEEYVQLQIRELQKDDPRRMSRRVQQGTPEYDHVKSLVDML